MLCRQADLILVMDLAQRRYLESTYPFVRGKVFRIADTLAQDVPDPYRQGRSRIRATRWPSSRPAPARGSTAS
jgi:protein-tyrosine phosphatase